MYGNGATYPFSTYAVGGARSPHLEARWGSWNGRKFVFPILAMFGTVSAVAITFASAERETPQASIAAGDGSADASNFAAKQAGRVAKPGFSIKIDSGQFAKAPENLLAPLIVSEAKTEAGLASREGTLARAPQTRIVQPPAASPLPSESIRNGGKLALRRASDRPRVSFAAVDCAADCITFDGENSTPLSSMVRHEAVQPLHDAGELTSTGKGGSPREEPVAPSLSDVAVPRPMGDLLPQSVIIADEQRPALVQVAGELGTADTTVDGAKEGAPADSSAMGADPIEGTPVRSTKSDTEVRRGGIVASSSADNPPARVLSPSSSPRTGDAAVPNSEAAKAVKAHLRRIEERYSASRAAPEPDTKDGQLARVGDSGLRSVATTTAPVAVPRQATQPSLVIHDDDLVAIRLGELVSLFEDHFDRPLYVWMSSSAAASKFVSLQTLAAAGIEAKYIPETNQLVFSVDQ